jgi:transcriptional repressor NF-X1
MKCGASKANEGNAVKTLPCNDECARLERNRKLAFALDIDQSTHVEGRDHIPYSTETLNLFAENSKWAQRQEREFRVFANSEEEKRLRFKPMRPQERAFIHALAEDFGLDSESMDPEPHRHVMIWKTPRFVSAPNKTLAEALRLRNAQRSSTTTSANVSDTEAPIKRAKPSNDAGEPYNGFLVSNVKFGLTIDEIRSELTALGNSGLTFDINFLPSEEVVLKATATRSLFPRDLQGTLETLKPAIASAITAKAYGTVQLCTTDSSLNILLRESDADTKSGWSKVASKKNTPLLRSAGVQSNALAGSNSFAALSGGGGGGKVTFAKKQQPAKTKPKKAQEAVVDDWEAAELAEEERERGFTSGEETSDPHPEASGEDDRAIFGLSKSNGTEEMAENGSV